MIRELQRYEVKCDSYREAAEVRADCRLVSAVFTSPTIALSLAIEAGWVSVDGEHYCPVCAKRRGIAA